MQVENSLAGQSALAHFQGGTLGHLDRQRPNVVTLAECQPLRTLFGKHELRPAGRGRGTLRGGVLHRKVPFVEVPGGRTARLRTTADGEVAACYDDVAVMVHDEGRIGVAGTLDGKGPFLDIDIPHDGNLRGVVGSGRGQIPTGRTGVEHPDIPADRHLVEVHVEIRQQIGRLENDVVIGLVAVCRCLGFQAGQMQRGSFGPGSQRDFAAVAVMLIDAAVADGQHAFFGMDHAWLIRRPVIVTATSTYTESVLCTVIVSAPVGALVAGARWPRCIVPRRKPGSSFHWRASGSLRPTAPSAAAPAGAPCPASTAL